jgi:hypothetical protein
MISNRQLDRYADLLRGALKQVDRKKHFQTYQQCWVGKEAVKWLSSHSSETGIKTEKEALLVCHELLHMHYIFRVHSDSKKTQLSDAGRAYRACFIPKKFYRFTTKATTHAHKDGITTPPSSPPQGGLGGGSISISGKRGSLTPSTTGPILDLPWYANWSGWLEKKRVKTVRVYQRRYFSLNLDDQALCYYMTSEEPFPIGIYLSTSTTLIYDSNGAWT